MCACICVCVRVCVCACACMREGEWEGGGREGVRVGRDGGRGVLNMTITCSNSTCIGEPGDNHAIASICINTDICRHLLYYSIGMYKCTCIYMYMYTHYFCGVVGGINM